MEFGYYRSLPSQPSPSFTNQKEGRAIGSHNTNHMYHRPRLLILGPLPPPVGGVETVTQAVLESEKLGEFDTRHCDTTKGRPKQTQGKFDLGNIRWANIHFSRLRGAMKRFKPDVVYMPVTATWSGFLRDAVLARIAKRRGAKVIGHVHGAWFDRILRRSGVSGRIVRTSLGYFDALLMLGNRWKKVVDDYGFPGQVLVVPSTFRREVFERGAAFERDYSKDGPGLFVGQVGKRKGVYDLLDAVKLLKERANPVKLVMVGPGEFEGEWESLLQKRKELGLEDEVTFTGSLNGEELYEQFRNASFFVLPSYDEGLPVVFFEAGAFALPVIGTPVGSIPDLLENERNALMVEPGDTEAIAAALHRMSSETELRRKLGTSLRQDIGPFHPDAVCEKIADAARNLVNAEEPGSR